MPKKGKTTKRKGATQKKKKAKHGLSSSYDAEPFMLQWMSSLSGSVAALQAAGITEEQLRTIRKVWSAPSLSWSIARNPFQDGRSDLLARAGMSGGDMDIFLSISSDVLASKAKIWVGTVYDDFPFVWHFYGQSPPNEASTEEWYKSSKEGKLYLSDLLALKSRSSGKSRGRRRGRAVKMISEPLLGTGLDKDQKSVLKRMMNLRLKGFAKKALHQHKEVVKNIKGKVDNHEAAVAAHAEKIKRRLSVQKIKLQARLDRQGKNKIKASVDRMMMVKRLGMVQPAPPPPSRSKGVATKSEEPPGRRGVFFDRAKPDGADALLQAVMRGHIAREKLKATSKAVSKIQAIYRGVAVRKVMDGALQSLTEQEANFVKMTVNKAGKKFLKKLTKQLDQDNTGMLDRSGVIALLQKFRVTHPVRMLAQMGAVEPDDGIKVDNFKAWLKGKKVKVTVKKKQMSKNRMSTKGMDKKTNLRNNNAYGVSEAERSAAVTKIQAARRGSVARKNLGLALENMETSESAFVRVTVSKAGPKFLKAIEKQLDPTGSGELSRSGIVALLKKLKVTRPEPILRKMGSARAGEAVNTRAFRDWLAGKETNTKSRKKSRKKSHKNEHSMEIMLKAATKIQALRRGVIARTLMTRALSKTEIRDIERVRTTLNKAGWPFLQALFKQLDPLDTGFLPKSGIMTLLRKLKVEHIPPIMRQLQSARQKDAVEKTHFVKWLAS